VHVYGIQTTKQSLLDTCEHGNDTSGPKERGNYETHISRRSLLTLSVPFFLFHSWTSVKYRCSI